MRNILIATIGATGLITAACSHSESTAADSHAAEQSLTTVHLDSADIARLGIVTETIEPDTFRPAIKLSGQIVPSSTNTYTVSAPGAGVVHFASDLHPGMSVAKGTLLARIDASAVSGAATDRVTAAELEGAKRNYQRIEALRHEGLATVDELNAALAQYQAAKAAHSTKAASGSVTTPVAGIITTLNVANGEAVTPGQPLATVTSGGKVTVRVDVPERHAAQISAIDGINILVAGDTALRHIPASQMSVNRGELFSDARGYIPLSLTVRSQGMLTTGSFADIYLLSSPEPKVLSVPRDALIEDQGSHFVYVALNPHEFERRKVQTGSFNGQRVKIAHGLNPGERVAVREVPMLRMAQSMSAPAQGHHH